MKNYSILLNGFLILFIVTMSFIQTNAQETRSAKKDFVITSYGAKGDGQSLDTEAIQKAIDEATKEKNGGKVIIPNGKFLTGSFELKTNVDLYLNEGAILLGSTDPRHYKKLSGNRALIMADEAKNITIKGKGTVDGQGRELALAIDSLHHAGIVIDPLYDTKNNRPKEVTRAELINFIRCSDIEIKGVTLKNASSWVQTYDQCTNLEIDDIKVSSRAYWNNDGIDIVDCINVRITNCDIDTADDGICLKSHSAAHYNDQIYIADCTVRSSASAVKFGTVSRGGFKNVVIENIKVFDTFRSAIAIESVDGGFIENVKVSNITAWNTGNAIFVRLGHRWGEKPGTLKNISFKNIDVEVPFGRPDIDYDMRGPEVDYFHNQFPAPVVGIPGHPVENLTFENITISYPGRASKGMAYVPLTRLDQVDENIKGYPEYTMFGELPAWGFYVRHAKNIQMKNIKLILNDSDFRPAFVFDDVSDLKMTEIDISTSKKHQIILKDATTIDLDKNALKLSSKL